MSKKHSREEALDAIDLCFEIAEFRSNTPDQSTGKAEPVPRPVHE